MQIHHLSGCPFVVLASCFDTGTGFLYGPLVLLKQKPLIPNVSPVVEVWYAQIVCSLPKSAVGCVW